MLADLYNKYKEPILYIVFGGLTTLVNIMAYYLLADVLLVYYLISNACAWGGSVLFAFVTNKLFVFESKSWKASIVLPEMGGFFLSRVATGVVDMVLMWLLIDIIQTGDMFAKILVNVIVVVLNYVASKLWIFRKK